MDKNLICDASKKLRLISINLFEGHLKRINTLPEKGELGQQLKLAVKPERLQLSSSEQSNEILRVFAELGVRVVLASPIPEEEPTPLFQIEAVYQIDYEINGSIGKPAIDEFVKYNAVHHVWPFWRQYVFSLSNQSGLPCPEIPLNTSLQSLDELRVDSV